MRRTPTQARILKFGTYEVDRDSGELYKSGVRQKLTGQHFEVLCLLLEHPHEVITRQDFQDRIWSKDTFVDYDVALRKAITHLRELLGDSAENPRFIETIPRKGYRFIAPVEIGGETKNEVSVASPIISGSVDAANRLAPVERERPAPWRWVGATSVRPHGLIGSVVVFALFSGAFVLYQHRKPVLTEQDTVVLGEFSNATGDPVFNDALTQALAVELRQSPLINILPDDKVRTTLTQMGRQAQESVNEQVAREICQRSQSKALITGSIASIGSQFVLGLKAVNCMTGEVLVQQQSEVARKEDILKSLRKQSSQLRRRLGESLASIQKFDLPLEQVTTSSLEALQAYSLGRKQGYQGDTSAALNLYRRAIELDPNFAMAYLRLASSYDRSGRFDLEKENGEKAFSLRQRATEHERLEIEGSYHWIRGESDKAAQAMELRRSIYPQDSDTYAMLSRIYEDFGDFEKALTAAREAYRRNPTRYTRLQFVSCYMDLGQLTEAGVLLAEDCPKDCTPSAESLALSYQLAFLRHDTTEMERIVRSAPSGLEDQADLLALVNQWQTEVYYGRVKKARAMHHHIVQLLLKNNTKEEAAVFLVQSARLDALYGNSADARRTVAEGVYLQRRNMYVAFTNSLDYAALTYARLGELHQAQALADELAKKCPTDTLVNRRSIPLIRAAIEISRNNPAQAIEILQDAASFELGDLEVVYTRGEAYLLLHRGGEAAVEFQKILDRRSLVRNDELGALAYLGVARAYAMADDITKAKTAYQEFLTLWKDADQDIPILRQAKSEYARLQ